MNLTSFRLLMVYLFYNSASADLIKDSLLEALNVTHNPKDQRFNEITHNNKDNNENVGEITNNKNDIDGIVLTNNPTDRDQQNNDSYNIIANNHYTSSTLQDDSTNSDSINRTFLNADTADAEKDPRSQNIDSNVNSENEVTIEILGETIQNSSKKITKETPRDTLLTSQIVLENGLKNNNILQIVEILVTNNQSSSETTTVSTNSDISIEANSADETSDNGATQVSGKYFLSQMITLDEDRKPDSSEIFLKIKPVSSADNTELPKNYTSDIFHVHCEASASVPTQHMSVERPKSSPQTTCDLDLVLRKGVCVPRSNTTKDTATEDSYRILEKSTFSLPCPPGTGRAADNTCQSRA